MLTGMGSGHVLDTIGRFIEHDHRLRVYCEGRDCRHVAMLDLVNVAAKLGADFPMGGPRLGYRMVCSACGTRGRVTFTVVAPGTQYAPRIDHIADYTRPAEPPRLFRRRRRGRNEPPPR